MSYKEKIQILETENNNLKQLILTLDDYNKLLSQEVDELAVLQIGRQWKSSRIEKGIEFRNKIKELKILTKLN